jgi:cyclopropane-fatty-acyl-phospholipid synthase
MEIVEVVGITISKEQFALTRELAKDYPVRILSQDYRDLKGHFDRVDEISSGRDFHDVRPPAGSP